MFVKYRLCITAPKLTSGICAESPCSPLLHVKRAFETTGLLCWLWGAVGGGGCCSGQRLSNMGSAHSSHSPTPSCYSQLIGELAFTLMEASRQTATSVNKHSSLSDVRVCVCTHAVLCNVADSKYTYA